MKSVGINVAEFRKAKNQISGKMDLKGEKT